MAIKPPVSPPIQFPVIQQRRVPFEDARTIKRAELRPIWPGYLYKGKLTLLSGAGGSGKTLVLCDLAARLSIGGELPDGRKLKEPIKSVLVVTEESADDTIIPRLEACGADFKNIHILRRYSFGGDFKDIAHDFVSRGIEVMFIEKLVDHLGNKTDYNKDGDVAPALFGLTKMLEAADMAAVAVKHYNKKAGVVGVSRDSGSTAFVNSARIVLGCDDASDLGAQYCLTVHKSFMAKKHPLLYRIDQVDSEHEQHIKPTWLGYSGVSATTSDPFEYISRLAWGYGLSRGPVSRPQFIAYLDDHGGRHFMAQLCTRFNLKVRRESKFGGPRVLLCPPAFHYCDIMPSMVVVPTPDLDPSVVLPDMPEIMPQEPDDFDPENYDEG